MTKTYIAHPLKCGAALLTAIFSLVMVIVMIDLKSWLGGLLFGLIFAFFTGVAVLYGARIRVDEQGVGRFFLWRRQRFLSWPEIKEVSVIGVNVFNRNNSKRTGSRYLCFWPQVMSEQERFRLALEWPPKEGIYMLYSPERLATVRRYWAGQIDSFNGGDLYWEK